MHNKIIKFLAVIVFSFGAHAQEDTEAKEFLFSENQSLEGQPQKDYERFLDFMRSSLVNQSFEDINRPNFFFSDWVWLIDDCLQEKIREYQGVQGLTVELNGESIPIKSCKAYVVYHADIFCGDCKRCIEDFSHGSVFYKGPFDLMDDKKSLRNAPSINDDYKDVEARGVRFVFNDMLKVSFNINKYGITIHEIDVVQRIEGSDSNTMNINWPYNLPHDLATVKFKLSKNA